MRSLKSGVFTVVLASFVGVAAVVGCSASGDSEGLGTSIDPTVAPPGTVEPPSKLPPSSGTDSGSGVDSSVPKKDSEPPKEASVDAGPPPPVEGTTCPTADTIAKRPCGSCGYSETVCLKQADGSLKWSPYGADCKNQVVNGCIPDTVVNEACGNCGTRVKTCNKFCSFVATACAGEPANSCKPGKIEYTGAGCAVAQTYRKRTCEPVCTWAAYSACATPVNEHVLTLGAAAGATVTKTVNLSAAKMGAQLGGACPAGSLEPGDYPLQYVEIKNPNAQPAKVTVYASQAPGSVLIDTVMASYATGVQPMDDAGRKVCSVGVNDESPNDVALTGNKMFSILKEVAIPAGGSVLVYVATYFEYVAGSAIPTTGDLNINALIETL